MAPQYPVNPELKSFVSTQLLFTRMDENAATDALEFLGVAEAGNETAEHLIVPAELVGV
ncbi:hypothetical protein GCM10023063_18190 [Arthrobacter methylotrophus]|uniref:Uncharacterized protein n=1 Tax=Arthrobacter methylotrophus TaxID=121291 RepID=A0ABV5UQ51_9MICC